MKTLAFTGHRPPRVLDEGMIKAKLRTVIEKAIDKGYSRFISGMALGSDLWAAEVVAEIALRHVFVQLIGAVPFAHQDEAWSRHPESQRRWRKTLQLCNELRLVDDKKNVSYEELMAIREKPRFYQMPGWKAAKLLDARNHWMVNNADSVLAIYDGVEKGGTYNCIKYAVLCDKKVVGISAVNGRVFQLNSPMNDEQV